MRKSGKSLVQFAKEKNLTSEQRKAAFEEFAKQNEESRQPQPPSEARAAAMAKAKFKPMVLGGSEAKPAESEQEQSDAPKQPKTYEQMKSEVEAINAKHEKGTKENSFAYRDWLNSLSPAEAREYIDNDAKERRFARRSRAAKKGVETKDRKADERTRTLNDPAGKNHVEKAIALTR